MFNNSSFLFLWSGQSFASFGDRLYMLGAIALIYTTTNSVLLSSFVPMTRLMMQFVSSIITPLVTAKLAVNRVLMISQLLQSCLFLFLLLILLYKEYSLPLILTIITVLAFFHSWVNPLKNAILPELVKKIELVKANNMLSITNQVVLFLGWVGGGFLISYFGYVFVLWITFFCFLFSTVFFYMIKGNLKNVSLKKRFSWGVLVEGWMYVLKSPLYRKLFLICSFQSIAGSVWSSAIILKFVKKVLEKDELWWGFMNGGWLLGTVASGFFLSKVIQRNLPFSLTTGLLVNGMMIFLFAICTDPILSLGIAFLIGIPFQIYDAAKKTILQMNIESERLPQVFAAYQAWESVFFGLGIFIMGVVSDSLNISLVYYIAALMTILSVFLANGVSKWVLRH